MSRHRLGRRRRNGLHLESLEPRQVLDSKLGLEAATPSVTAEDASTLIPSVMRAEGESVPFAAFVSEAELRHYLVDAALARWGGLFGQPAWSVWWRGDFDADFDAPPGVVTVNSAGEVYTGTNVQVVGVDEGDAVKTDGDYLYFLGKGAVTIVDIRDPANMQIAARVPLDGQAWPCEMYVIGDRLALISQSYRQPAEEPGPNDGGVGSGDSEPAFRSLADHWVPFEAFVQVSVYDIADRTAPKWIQTTEMDGQRLDSRAIGESLVIVLQDDIGLPPPETHCAAVSNDGIPPKEPGGNTDPALLFSILPDDRIGIPWPSPNERCVYETKEEYLARVLNPEAAVELPTYRTVEGSGELIASGHLHEPQGIYHRESAGATNLVSVVMFAVADPQPEPISSSAVFVDSVNELYATADSLYVASPVWGGADVKTELYRFSISNSEIDLTAVGAVPGRPLNQFALDEYAGYLRIATTQGWGDAATNGLYVLREDDGRLVSVGQVEGLAAGETIFAVRFFAESAFVMTFRQIDPLFAIDLSDPTAPQVVGELKIPGFSHYLHPVDDGFLVGLGRDADETTGMAGQPNLTLFDVSDLGHPQLVDRFLIELGGWGYSDAFFDHHAIGYFPSHHVLVVPFQESGWIPVDSGENGLREEWRPRYDFWVFQLQPGSGDGAIQLLGRIEHDSPTLRSLRVGDHLFTVSLDTVKAHALLDPSQEIGEVSLVDAVVEDEFWVPFGSQNQALDVLANDCGRVPATDPGITAVTQPSEGGTVEIAPDGRRLFYTPPADFTGMDEFQYTAFGETASVVVHVSDAEELVRIRLEVTDAEGSPITRIEVGAEFQVNVWLEDLREDPAGVFSAFVDLSFDAALAKALGQITIGGDYAYGSTGSIAEPGRVDDVGGHASQERLGSGEKLLASVPMAARDVGRARFSADPADVLPAHKLVLYDSAQSVAAASVEVADTVLEIVDGFQNSREATDTNSDGFTSPVDAIILVNFLNSHGPASVEALRSLGARHGDSDQTDPSQEGIVHYYYDTNGDRYVTPIDVLLVVNSLNHPIGSKPPAAAGTAGEGEIDSSTSAADPSLSELPAARTAIEEDRADNAAAPLRPRASASPSTVARERAQDLAQAVQRQQSDWRSLVRDVAARQRKDDLRPADALFTELGLLAPPEST